MPRRGILGPVSALRAGGWPARLGTVPAPEKTHYFFKNAKSGPTQQRRVALRVGGRRVRTLVQQHLGKLEVQRLAGGQQWRVALRVGGRRVRAIVQQHLGELEVPHRAGEQQRRVVFAVLYVQSGTSADQQLEQRLVPLLCRSMNGAPSTRSVLLILVKGVGLALPPRRKRHAQEHGHVPSATVRAGGVLQGMLTRDEVEDEERRLALREEREQALQRAAGVAALRQRGDKLKERSRGGRVVQRAGADGRRPKLCCLPATL